MFMNDISILSRQMRVFAERQLADLHLGFPELRILMYLNDHESSNQEQISSHFKVDKGSIAKSVGKLVEKGFVERTVNPDNRREKSISLTHTGHQAMSRMGVLFETWSTTVFAGIDTADLKTMFRALAIMAENSTALIESEA